MRSHPLIDLVSPPESGGATDDRVSGDLIQANLETYRRLFLKTRLSWSEVRSRIPTFDSAMEAWSQDLYWQFQAFGNSAGVSVEGLLVLNARTSILHSARDQYARLAILAPTPKAVSVLDSTGATWSR